jgi:hypothetical protein
VGEELRRLDETERAVLSNLSCKRSFETTVCFLEKMYWSERREEDRMTLLLDLALKLLVTAGVDISLPILTWPDLISKSGDRPALAVSPRRLPQT